VNCRVVEAFLCPAGQWPNYARRRWRAALSRRSVAPPSGAGSARTHCGLGVIGPGSSHAIRTSPARLVGSSIFTSAVGMEPHWDHAITSFVPTRRPPSRPGRANIAHCRPPQGARSTSSTNTRVPAHWLTSPPGTCIAQSCSAVASARNGIAAFGRLVAQVMGKEPYRSAGRVFLIADNGSSHRGQRAADRLRARWPNLVLVHTPIHARWLDQIEVYFSIVQRKLLTPSDFADLAALKHALIGSQTAISVPPNRSCGPSPDAICKGSWPGSGLIVLHQAKRYRPEIRHRNYESGY